MWSLQPSFFDEHSDLWIDLPELASEDADLWLGVSKAFPTLSITGSVKGVAVQSVVAAQRYRQVQKLEQKYPNWMLIKVLLGEMHFLMNDAFGALQYLLQVQYAVGSGKDQCMDSAVLELSKLVEGEGEEEEEEEEEGITVIYYKRPGCFLSVQCSWSVEGIRKAWQVLEQTKTREALNEFARYVAISTNILEEVFSLDGQSMSKLVKRGFYVNSIEGISATSRIKKKDKIVTILKNTESCLQYLHKDIDLDQSMIQGLHNTLMEGDNLSWEKDDEDQVYVSFVPCGVYRRVPCYARHQRHHKETRYCPWRQVPEEMEWYIQEAHLALSDKSADPFLVSAWLQWAFLTIHPFADGNGRVSRMISSIPLIKVGLPPVVVSSEHKHKYFDALLEADSSGDLVPLASFLKDEVDLAIAHISSLDDD